MPSLGADMDEGTVIEWKVAPGDAVCKGDVLLAVETEKSDIDVETWHDGVVTELLAQPGDTVQVGTIVARMMPADGAVAPAPAPAPAPVPAPNPVPAPPIVSPLVRHLVESGGVDPRRLTGSGPGGRITRHDAEAAMAARHHPEPVARGSDIRSRHRPAASPLARRVAERLGLDLTQVAGTGPGGAILRMDVERARVEAPTPATTDPTSRADRGADRSRSIPADRSRSMRQAIARQMARSKREIPHYYLWSTIDLGSVLDRLTEENEQRPVERRLLPAALLLHATAVAAEAHSEMNGLWIDDEFRPTPTVDLGVVIALRGGGLAAPVIADAANLTTDELMGRLKDQVGRARSGKLRSSDTRPATITVTNLGDLGGDAVLGVIHPPQVAIVGFGHIDQRPVVVDGSVTVRPTVTVSLAADHRASDGMRGARFLKAIETALLSWPTTASTSEAGATNAAASKAGATTTEGARP